MNRYTYLLAAWLLVLLQATPGHAQFNTPNTNGIIVAGEYGNSDNTFRTNEGGTWYMTWDADNLYVAKTGGGATEPAILYLDLNPVLPVTGGPTTGININNTPPVGATDNGVTPILPFLGDIRVRFNNGTIELQRGDNQGTWSTLNESNATIASTTTSPNGNVRELRINWATLTSGVTPPPSFNWLGYVYNPSNGYRYDQAPYSPDAMGFAGGNAPHLDYYFTVASTANGSATKPFMLKSYTFSGTSDNNSFGAIDVWDFTMNSPNLQISRGTTKGNWNIGGSLVVGAGTIYFGNSTNSSDFGTTDVGNVRVIGGRLDMDQAPKPINVRESVFLTGGQFRLSGVQGGDLLVGRHFTAAYNAPGTATATFQASGRAVTFIGAGVKHDVQSTGSEPIPFDFLSLDTSSGSVNLGSNIVVNRVLNFYQGNLITNQYYVQLAPIANLSVETASSHILGQVRITQYVGAGQTGTPSFGNIGLYLSPQNASAALGSTTITRTTGYSLFVGGPTNSGSIARYYTVAGTDTKNLDITLQLYYRTDELNGIPESKLALFQSPSNYGFERITTPPSANTDNHSLMTTTNLTEIPSGTYFTVGDGTTPLPVTLASFTATATAQGAALLRWTTAMEANSKGFGIERQLGASGTWEKVGYVAAANLVQGSSYSFTDNSLLSAPASSNAYYRLRQEDKDGSRSYSPVAAISRGTGTATELVLSPVPVSGASLSVAFAEAGQAGTDVAVLNTQGQRVLHLLTAASPDNSLNLPVANLAAGVYIVSVQVPGQAVRHARFIKL